MCSSKNPINPLFKSTSERGTSESQRAGEKPGLPEFWLSDIKSVHRAGTLVLLIGGSARINPIPWKYPPPPALLEIMEKQGRGDFQGVGLVYFENDTMIWTDSFCNQNGASIQRVWSIDSALWPLSVLMNLDNSTFSFKKQVPKSYSRSQMVNSSI